MDYVIDFAIEDAVWISITSASLVCSASLCPNQGESLRHPYGCDSGTPDLSKARVLAESRLAQTADNQDREIDELSCEEKRLRRPPSPFLLLDADASRPELPTDARVIPIISVP